MKRNNYSTIFISSGRLRDGRTKVVYDHCLAVWEPSEMQVDAGDIDLKYDRWGKFLPTVYLSL